MTTTPVTHLDEIVDEVDRRITTTIWCTMATTDAAGRPRTRIVHPIWERAGRELIGWLGTRTGTPKLGHLERTPWASLLYWDPRHQQVTLDVEVEIHRDDDTRRRVWDLMSSVAEPYGFDPAPMWPDGATGDGFTVLRLRPERVVLFGDPVRIWRS